MTPPPRLDALTGVRGIAAWAVVFFHIRLSLAAFLPGAVITILSKGYLAVDLFFVLSGFVIWLTYGDRLAEGGWRTAPPFFRRRIARIYPLHIVVLALTAGLALSLQAAGRPNADQFPWPLLPLNMALMHNWGFTGRLAWNDPSWSISAEWAAYLLLPLAAPAIAWRGWTPVRAGLAIFGLGSGLYGWMAVHGVPTLGIDVPRFGLVRCLFEFVMGALMCRIWRSTDNRRLTMGSASALIVTIMLYSMGLPETLCAPLGCVTLVGLLAATSGARGNVFETRALVWLGEISYSTYLIHFVLWIVFKLLFVHDLRAVPPLLILAYLTTTLAASALLYHLVEQPGRRWVATLGRPRLTGTARSAP